MTVTPAKSKGIGTPPFMDYIPHMHCEYCGKFVGIDKQNKIASCHPCRASWLILFGTADCERQRWLQAATEESGNKLE